ncbi:ABC-F family ATP-binding cassette domain-containing protein [Achromobacter sp. GD03932]|uniref:ABC-F family ATP-binding cassette domain-containing protein n=1 Tax=Achromobacter sp. GD03932 TaxID=2975407 RepID=UPI00244CBC9B|nr:ABC-F family ATP-binding cassette domain-containing protein [Achromobacter sp. GD03932]MDH1303022.1 ATP-binding cassette domain-containing protein [Achromobacter sp. GD03932]
MTNPYIALEGVSYVLPDGRTLFSGLDEQFDLRPAGLVGRNGVGKSVLARILAGQLPPAHGRCLRSGSVHYLAQQAAPGAAETVAGLAGMQATLAALGRIEAGSAAAEDFDIVGERWDARLALQQELERCGLGHLDAATPAAALSGGEAMRVALIGALLSDADFLILDEPTNHLDRPNRLALAEQLRRWPRGLLVISHDRQLLEAMQRIVELSPLGMRGYGGGYSFYAQRKEEERGRALSLLEQRKHERQREEQALREQRERQERRQARGNRQARDANQAKILLGRQKARSETSAGKLRRQHEAASEQLVLRVREAAGQIDEQDAIVLHAPPAAMPAQRRVAELDAVELPFVPAATRRIDLALGGRQRVGVVGPNGCGKSTLLKVLAGQLQASGGTCRVAAKAVYLDQRLAMLAPQQSVLAQLQAANRGATQADLRTRLAQLGLDARKIAAPSGELSGGERLKAALACALYADPPAQLLLLDEPSNHLDLPSMQALEAMLRAYRGALVVVSHDDAFMDSLDLTHRLAAGSGGWRMETI